MNQRVLFFDLLRCVAAFAVIGIHVLAPYRGELGVIPFGEWLSAVSINGMSRWAVPVFILISGALLLSDERPFDSSYYLKRRVGKVVVPFLIWSLFYAWLAGWSSRGYDASIIREALQNGAEHETYYHLGFFYYFIPLYLIMPLFQWVAQNKNDNILVGYVVVWLITTVLYMFYVDGFWSTEYWLYSGYLPLGYLLYRAWPLNSATITLALVLGIPALIMTVAMVVMRSLEYGEYMVERWLSYKTINVVLVSSMIFILCRGIADRLSERTATIVRFISRYSMGIYILHPIFLWPLLELNWYEGHHPLWIIPVWVMLSGSASLLVSWLVAQSAKTRWLLP